MVLTGSNSSTDIGGISLDDMAEEPMDLCPVYLGEMAVYGGDNFDQREEDENFYE